jgi:uncharacterized protein (TIGR02147 family)
VLGNDLTYKNLIQEEFDSRRKRNLGYSLRAYARDLKMPASKLSEVMRGICGLSAKSAARLAPKLKLSPSETEWFIQSVEAHHNRSLQGRKQAKEMLKTISEREGFSELSLESFKIISDWCHFAIMELTEVPGFKSDVKWIAARLDITEAEARSAIKRLIDFGLLEQSNEKRLRQTHVNLATPTGIPSREIRKHHSQILMKAEQALEAVPVNERDFSALTMTFSQEQMEEARTLIKDFRRKFDRIMKAGSSPKDRVYALSIQLFPLDRPGHRKS